MKHEFKHSDTGEMLLVVEDEEYNPGVPGLSIVTPPAQEGVGILMDAEEVIRLRGILDDWIARNVVYT